MVISLLLMLIKPVNAQDFQTMQQGDVAPFNGALLTPDAVATIISTHQAEVSLCEENNKHDIEKLIINKDTEISKLQFELKICQENKEEIISIKDKELDKAYELLKKQNKNMTPLWLGIGFASGFATSLATIYIYEQANQ
jgi:2-phosphoglycerate kinase